MGDRNIQFRGPAVGLALCLAAAPAFATEYRNNPNPACREMRNSKVGAPFPAEPNRDDARVAMALAGDAMAPNNRLPILRRYDARALPLLLKIAPNDLTTADWMSRRAGQTTLIAENTSENVSVTTGQHGEGINWNQVGRPLYLPHELMGFVEGTGIFWLAGMASGVRYFAPP